MFLLMFSFFFLLERHLQKSLSFHRLRADRDEIWQDYSSVPSIDRVGSSIRRHTFRMVAMMSFDAENCCQLVSEHEPSVMHLCSSITSSISIVYSYLLCGWYH